MRWMMLQDTSNRIWLWREGNGILINSNIQQFTKSTEMCICTTFSPDALDSQMLAAWYQNTRTATAGGKSFEVLASGRI